MAWYECKVSYPRDFGNGLEKRVTETYLVDAVSYTEAEARITDTLRPCVPGGFSVSGIRRSGYAEVFADGEGDWFYNVRILFFTLDEKSGAEKHSTRRMLVRAPSLGKALERFGRQMEGTLLDYKVVGVEETPLIDVFTFKGRKP